MPVPNLDDAPSDTSSAGAPPRRTRGSGAALALLASSLVANVLGYGLYLVVNHTQSSVDIGVVTAILNLAIITAVPALAAQLVTARRAARLGRAPSEPDLAALVRGATRTGVTLGGWGLLLLVLAAPLLAWLLRLDSVVPALVLAAMLPASSTTYALLGVLQGRHAFARYGLVTVVINGLRVVAALLAALTGMGANGLLCLTLVASYGGMAVTLLLVPSRRLPAPAPSGSWVKESLAASASTAVVFVVSNLDVPLARQVLSEVAAGEYAVLSLFTKATFWGSAFLATLFFPAMARARSHRAVTVAVTVTAGIGLAATTISALLAEPLARVAGGDAAARHSGLVWLFTLIGALWAVCQVIIYWGVATQHPAPRNLAWVVVVAVAALALLRPTNGPEDVAVVLAGGGAALASGGLAVLWWARRQRPTGETERSPTAAAAPPPAVL